MLTCFDSFAALVTFWMSLCDMHVEIGHLHSRSQLWNAHISFWDLLFLIVNRDDKNALYNTLGAAQENITIIQLIYLSSERCFMLSLHFLESYLVDHKALQLHVALFWLCDDDVAFSVPKVKKKKVFWPSIGLICAYVCMAQLYCQLGNAFHMHIIWYEITS